MTKLWLGRDAYKRYSYGLFERKPSRKMLQQEVLGHQGMMIFTNYGRCCVISDKEFEWMFGPLELNVGDVVQVEITVLDGENEG